MGKTFVVILLLTCMLGATETTAQSRKGEKVPNIQLKDSSGNEISLYDINSKLILIDFWASWCGPCRKANKELYSTYQKFQNNGFEIFGVSLDKEPGDWREAIVTDRIKWKQVIDHGGWDAAVAVSWKIEYLPSTFLVNENKELIAINPTKSQIERYLKKLRK